MSDPREELWAAQDTIRELRVQATVRESQHRAELSALRGVIDYLERSRDEWIASYERAMGVAAGVAGRRAGDDGGAPTLPGAPSSSEVPPCQR